MTFESLRSFANECIRRIEATPQLDGDELHFKQAYVEIIAALDMLADREERIRVLTIERDNQYEENVSQIAERAKVQARIERVMGLAEEFEAMSKQDSLRNCAGEIDHAENAAFEIGKEVYAKCAALIQAALDGETK